MDRRAFLGTLAAAALPGEAAAAPAVRRSPQAARLPNVVFIFTDDQR
jgi:hypothetical protein